MSLGREKKIDLEKMTPERREILGQEIDKKVAQIINEAEEKLKFLNIYGLGYKMVVGLAEKGKEEEQIEKLIGCKIYKKRKK